MTYNIKGLREIKQTAEVGLRIIVQQVGCMLSKDDQAISKACYYHIRQLRCIRPYLDSTTACTNATFLVHSKLDYCNSLYYNLPKSQITRLQLIQNSLDRPCSC